MIALLSAIGSILLVDLALSGDNALVIGAAVAGLSRKERGIAIALGGGGAIVLRVVFAFLASFLLQLPWLQALGGIVLLFVAIRLLADRQPAGHSSSETTRTTSQSAARGLFSALMTILIADVTMSLDNVLAVGALAQGNLLVLGIGIFLSIVIVLLGSALVAELMKWLPWLLDVAALILAWTGANMILHDLRLGDILNDYSWTAIAVPALAFVIVLGSDILLRVRDHRRANISHT